MEIIDKAIIIVIWFIISLTLIFASNFNLIVTLSCMFIWVVMMVYNIFNDIEQIKEGGR